MKGRLFAEAKYVQIVLNRYVFTKDTLQARLEKVDAIIERAVMLIREGGDSGPEARRVPPADAGHRISKTYKRRMTDLLKQDSSYRWLKAPPQEDSEAGRLCATTVALLLRLCAPEAFGGFFLDLVRNYVRPSSDEEGGFI